MRFLKNNYFNAPPRTSDEMAALLLAVHDGTATPILASNVISGMNPILSRIVA
jgi:hypothetical protein